MYSTVCRRLSVGVAGIRSRALSGGGGGGGKEWDIVLVGGGIVGLATARALAAAHPKLRLAVLDKEPKIAQHQTKWNSGVLHAGIYYTPGSLKAQLCVKGIHQIYDYCDKKGVPYKKIGKLIVAVRPDEIPRLDDLYQRATQNGVRDLQIVEADRIKEFEPHAKGLKALWSPHTGITDFAVLAHSYAEDFKESGGTIITGRKVTAINLQDGLIHIQPENSAPIASKYVITCAGLYSDRVSAMTGCSKEPRILPFRGEWLRVAPDKANLVKANIYPVPNPKFPFLGVHFTPRLDGELWVGPNAVLATAREGYKLSNVNLKDLAEALTFSGLRKLVLRNISFGVGELYRSVSIGAQMKEAQMYVPEITSADVVRGAAGVRAQALNSDGNMVEDFLYDSGPGELGTKVLHIRNAPSPAATSSLAIAELIADKVKEKFALTS